MSDASRDGLRALERCNWSTDWVPPHTRVIETPPFCALVSPVRSGRFNSVLRCHEKGADLAARMHAVDALYAGRRARFHAYAHRSSRALRQHLDAIGFAPEITYDARVIESADVVGDTGVSDIHFAAVTTLACLRDAETVITQVFDGERMPPSEAELTHHMAQIHAGKVHQIVGYDTQSGEPVAQGGLSVFPALGIGLLFGGSTLTTHRGRGIYRALIRRRAAVCRALKLPHMGLWAHRETSSPITARQGFVQCGTMTRWTRDATSL